jgi:predicted HAD superfamily phosphohydrolase YqeG
MEKDEGYLLEARERNGERVVKTRIAFDVDGTLIRHTANGDVPRYEVIAMLRTLVSLGHTVFVWSGGGTDYAEMWSRKLGLLPDVRVIGKSSSFGIQLAFDDEDLTIAEVTVRV